MNKKKILVVDDEESIRNLIGRFLGKYYTVLGAENGEVAVEVAVREKPDLILMDIKMPKVNGYTSCSRIKADIRTKSTPVIMITAVACNLNDRKIMQAIGAEGYVTKPLNLKELRAIVEGFLAHGTRSDEIL